MTDRPPGPPEPPGGWIPLDPPSPSSTPVGPPVPPGGWIPLDPSGPPPPPPPPPPPLGPGTTAASSGRRRRRWLLPAAGLLAVVGGAAAVVAVRDTDAGHPDEWDARVLELVDFVEDERGLTFDHPVQVEFLDEEEWAERGEVDEEELLEEDLQMLEHGEGLFRAVGLAEGDFDLLSDMEDLGTSGTVGVYQFDEELISVRGDTVTAEAEATLVHELTHVLQDQHFAIGDRLEQLSQDDDSTEGSLRVLVEGDADRIEDRWVASLSDDERDALEEEQSATGEEATETFDALPASLVTFFASDYILGAGFLSVLEAADGTSAIDDAFQSPPGPEEHVLDPLSFLAHDDPTEVEPPDVDGEPIEELDGDFGAVSWYLMLAERTDPVTALAAVDGWGGDAFVGFRDGERTCAALRFAGEDEDAAIAMEAALGAWGAAMPAGAGVVVRRDGDVVDLVTCDPGTEADLLEGTGRSRETISLLATRSSLVAEVLTGGGSEEQAGCFSRGLIADLDYEILVASSVTPEQQQAINASVQAQLARCP